MEISSKEALTQKVHSYRIGTEVTLTIQRSSNGKYKEIELKVKLKGKSTIDGLEGFISSSKIGIAREIGIAKPMPSTLSSAYFTEGIPITSPVQVFL